MGRLAADFRREEGGGRRLREVRPGAVTRRAVNRRRPMGRRCRIRSAAAGYGPPPGYQPVPQPPRPKSGANVALIVLLIVAGVMVLGGVGCATIIYLGYRSDQAAQRADEKHAAEVAAAQRAAQQQAQQQANTPPPPTPTWITSERPFVKFLPPPGWTKNIKGDWAVFTSPTATAVYAFTTFSQPGESTTRLAKAAWVLGVEDIRWGAPVWGQIGRDHYRAHMGEGTCNFHGPGGYIWYATANGGSTDQMLLIYTVSSRGTKADKDAVLASIGSLQKR